jgi:hypothetical protein
MIGVRYAAALFETIIDLPSLTLLVGFMNDNVTGGALHSVNAVIVPVFACTDLIWCAGSPRSRRRKKCHEHATK